MAKKWPKIAKNGPKITQNGPKISTSRKKQHRYICRICRFLHLCLCPILIWSQPATPLLQLILSSHFIHEVRVESLISGFKGKFITHYFLYDAVSGWVEESVSHSAIIAKSSHIKSTSKVPCAFLVFLFFWKRRCTHNKQHAGCCQGGGGVPPWCPMAQALHCFFCNNSVFPLY